MQSSPIRWRNRRRGVAPAGLSRIGTSDMLVMGISCYYHDSAVAVLDETAIRFAIHEERLSRVKHDARFPVLAIGHALEACGIGINDIDKIVFYEDPTVKLNRLWNQVI